MDFSLGFTLLVILPSFCILPAFFQIDQSLNSLIETPEEKDHAAICNNEALKQAILASLNELATKNKFNGLERIKKLYLHPLEFAIEDGLLTPSMKVKRNVAAKYFRPQIDMLYGN